MIFSLQTFKLFEKLADHDRERRQSELQKREESRSVPPAVQELEISAEPPEGTEERSTEAAQTESSSLEAGGVSTEATGGSQPSSSGPGPSPQGDQAAAASTSTADG